MDAWQLAGDHDVHQSLACRPGHSIKKEGTAYQVSCWGGQRSFHSKWYSSCLLNKPLKSEIQSTAHSVKTDGWHGCWWCRHPSFGFLHKWRASWPDRISKWKGSGYLRYPYWIAIIWWWSHGSGIACGPSGHLTVWYHPSGRVEGCGHPSPERGRIIGTAAIIKAYRRTSY